MNEYGNYLRHSFFDLSVKDVARPMISSPGSYS
jgi:hypothetical protein